MGYFSNALRDLWDGSVGTQNQLHFIRKRFEAMSACKWDSIDAKNYIMAGRALMEASYHGNRGNLPRENDFRHWGWDKIAAISQTTFSNAFSWNKNMWISLMISLKFVSKDRINNFPALAQITVWRRAGDKPFSEPMMVSFLTHIHVCVNELNDEKIYLNSIILIHLYLVNNY